MKKEISDAEVNAHIEHAIKNNPELKEKVEEYNRMHNERVENFRKAVDRITDKR